MKNEIVLDGYGVVEIPYIEKLDSNGGGWFPGFLIGQIYSEANSAWKDIMQGYEYCSCKLNNPPQ